MMRSRTGEGDGGKGTFQEALWKKSRQGLRADGVKVLREQEGVKMNQVDRNAIYCDAKTSEAQFHVDSCG